MSNDIECPYCGHSYDLCHDDGAFYTEDEPEEDQCPECGKSFMVYTSISFYHEGQKADCLNGDEHNWSEWSWMWRGDKELHDGEHLERRYCQDCSEEQKIWHKTPLDPKGARR